MADSDAAADGAAVRLGMMMGFRPKFKLGVGRKPRLDGGRRPALPSFMDDVALGGTGAALEPELDDDGSVAWATGGACAALGDANAVAAPVTD